MTPSERIKASVFAEPTVNTQVVREDLDAAYEEMAKDKAAEAEALEWSEVMIGDIAGNPLAVEDMSLIEVAIRTQVDLA